MNESCQSPINKPAIFGSTTNIAPEDVTPNQLKFLNGVIYEEDKNRQEFDQLPNLNNAKSSNESEENKLYDVNVNDNSDLNKINNSFAKKGEIIGKNSSESIKQITINSNNSSSKTRENTIPKFLTKKSREPTGRISNEQKKKGIEGKKTDLNIDNRINKIKAVVIVTARESINKEIKKKEEIDIFELKRIDSSTYKNVSVKFNRELMEKTMEEIFRGKISGLYDNDGNNIIIDNNDLINYIKEDKNKKGYDFVNYILRKTFLQYLKLCRGSQNDGDLTEEYSVEIKEMRQLFEEKIKKKCEKKNEDYKKALWDVINDFEVIFKDKNERKSRKKENEGDKKRKNE